MQEDYIVNSPQNIDDDDYKNKLRRTNRIDEVFSWCLVSVTIITTFVICCGVIFSAFIYGDYMLNPQESKEPIIQTIEKVTVFIVGGVTGFFVRLINRSTGG